VFLDQGVDEDILASDTAEEVEINALVEERDEAEREVSGAPEEEAEGVVLKNKEPT